MNLPAIKNDYRRGKRTIGCNNRYSLVSCFHCLLKVGFHKCCVISYPNEMHDSLVLYQCLH